MQLMRDAKAADPIAASPTPQWSQGRDYAEKLFGYKREAVGDGWIKSIVALSTIVRTGKDSTGSANQCLGYLKRLSRRRKTFLGNDFKKNCQGVDGVKPLDWAKQDALSVKYIGSLLQPSSGARF